jgi:chemotaxis protein histidine kinase CheA
MDTTSGRGVGMDLVKERVQSRKGNIKVNTNEGEYSEFEIMIPLS